MYHQTQPMPAMSPSPADARPVPTDEELLERARDGDDRAFRALVERYESVVAATAIGMLGRGEEAEEVGQVTFVRFYRALDQFRGDAALGTYLTRIAINLSLNAIKRRKRRRDRFVSRDQFERLDEPAVDASEALETFDRAELVRRAIHELPEPFRAVVVLRMMRGFSTRETADLLEIPIGTVLSRLSRGQDRLRAMLAPYIHDEHG